LGELIELIFEVLDARVTSQAWMLLVWLAALGLVALGVFAGELRRGDRVESAAGGELLGSAFALGGAAAVGSAIFLLLATLVGGLVINLAPRWWPPAAMLRELYMFAPPILLVALFGGALKRVGWLAGIALLAVWAATLVVPAAGERLYREIMLAHQGHSEEVLQTYLRTWPGGASAEHSRDALDDRAWGYGDDPLGYLAAFPDGRHVRQAIAAAPSGDLVHHLLGGAPTAHAAQAAPTMAEADLAAVVAATADLELARVAISAIDEPATLETLIADHPGHVARVEMAGRLEETSWARARQGPVRALQDHLARYPRSADAATAEAEIARLRADETLYAAIFEQRGVTAALEQFLADYPGHSREADARAVLAGVRLDEGIADGRIVALFNGCGIRNLCGSITNKTEEFLIVRVPPGSYFSPDNDNAQPMVVTANTAITPPPGEEREQSLSVACADINRAVPSSFDTFTMRPPADDQLTATARMLAEENVNYAVTQAAIWIVANNASDSALGVLVERTSSSGIPTGERQIITPQIAAAARALLAEHGLDGG
jgi:hypothetical protein